MLAVLEGGYKPYKVEKHWFNLKYDRLFLALLLYKTSRLV